jgi:hypothetical protein
MDKYELVLNDLEFEKSFWGNCCNTFDEEQKHYIYAKYMMLDRVAYSFNVNHKKILDIGGGPCSILLKSINLQYGAVCDPIQYPQWVMDRYKIKGIDFILSKAEQCKQIDLGISIPNTDLHTFWDEIWIYNCLQHTDDPENIVRRAVKRCMTLRIFEWIDIPPHEGHPHCLTEANLNEWIGKKPGGVVELAEGGCFGRAYYNATSIG